MSTRVKDHGDQSQIDSDALYNLATVRQAIIDYLEARQSRVALGDGDPKVFHQVGGNSYTFDELRREVETESVTGLAYIEAIAEAAKADDVDVKEFLGPVS